MIARLVTLFSLTFTDTPGLGLPSILPPPFIASSVKHTKKTYCILENWFYLEAGNIQASELGTIPRIGMDYAGECSISSRFCRNRKKDRKKNIWTCHNLTNAWLKNERELEDEQP